MFAAIFMRQPGRNPRDIISPEALETALSLGGFGDKRGHWSNERILMAQSLLWNTPESQHESVPEVCPDTGRVIVSWVRLDNRAELCAALELELRETLTDPQIILAAHRKWGEDCANLLEGDFSFVIYDPKSDQAFCARDTIGARPLLFGSVKDAFVVATSYATLRAIELVEPMPSDDWLVSYLCCMDGDPFRTPSEQVRRLPPAHYLSVAGAQHVGPTRYFAFDPMAKAASRRNPDILESYRATFFEAVDCRLRSSYLVGCESSGGLDSSSIMGRAVQTVWHGPENLHCFGLMECPAEPQWLLRTPMQLGVAHTHSFVRRSIHHEDNLLDRAIEALGHPLDNDVPYAMAPFYDACQQYGLRSLLSGFGGDQLVTQSALISQASLLRQAPFTFLHQNRAKLGPRRLGALAKRAFVKNEYQRPLEEFVHSLQFLQSNLLYSTERSQTNGAFLKKLTERSRDIRTLGEYQLHHPGFTDEIPLRLESCALMARSYGVEMSWPLLDRRLIAEYLAAPDIEKTNGNIGRYLHRRAAHGLAPDDVIWKLRKFMGGAAVWSLKPEDPLAGIDWSDLPLALQKLIDPTKIEHAKKTALGTSNETSMDTRRLSRKSLQDARLLVHYLASL